MEIRTKGVTAILLFLTPTLGGAFAGAQQPSAHVHLAHVTSEFPGAPGNRGLAVATAEEISLTMMHANLAAGDMTNLQNVQTHARDVLHLLNPEEVVEGPGLDFGVIPGARAITRHVEMAANAGDASESLRTHAAHVAQAGRALANRAVEIAQIAQDVLTAETVADAAPLVAEMRTRALQLDTGFDRDQSGRLDLNGLEGGMGQLEDHLYLILEGEMLPRILD